MKNWCNILLSVVFVAETVVEWVLCVVNCMYQECSRACPRFFIGGVSQDLRAEGWERGILGEGQQPPPHQLGVWGSTMSSTSTVRGRALTAQRFSTIFSTQDGPSWHYNIVIMDYHAAIGGGARPLCPSLAYTPEYASIWAVLEIELAVCCGTMETLCQEETCFCMCVCVCLRKQLWQSVPVVVGDLGRPAGWTVEWNHFNRFTGLHRQLMLAYDTWSSIVKCALKVNNNCISLYRTKRNVRLFLSLYSVNPPDDFRNNECFIVFLISVELPLFRQQMGLRHTYCLSSVCQTDERKVSVTLRTDLRTDLGEMFRVDSMWD